MRFPLQEAVADRPHIGHAGGVQQQYAGDQRGDFLGDAHGGAHVIGALMEDGDDDGGQHRPEGGRAAEQRHRNGIVAHCAQGLGDDRVRIAQIVRHARKPRQHPRDAHGRDDAALHVDAEITGAVTVFADGAKLEAKMNLYTLM